MSTSAALSQSLRSEQARIEALRAEAAIEPEAAPSATPTKQTQIIAIYGKGGIGKSFALANLSYMMAQQGKKVLLIGCDPKSDTTSLLFGGRACPTILETSAKKKLAGEPVQVGDVCFKRDGVFAMELGGPDVGRGCGGRGIIHGFELLEKLGFHDWGFDFVLLDFLGDVVCGGFGLPIARDMCQKVIVVGSNDLQSLYVANNVCSAVEYFRKLGGNVGVAGLVINKDDGTGEAQAFAEAVGIPVLAAIPADDDIRRKSANYDIVGRPGTTWGPLFEELAAKNVSEAPPLRPRPLTQDGLLALFKGEVVGRNVVLDPASLEDMCGSLGMSRSPPSRSSTTRSEPMSAAPDQMSVTARQSQRRGARTATAARTSCAARPPRPARARRSTAMPPTIRSGPTTSRRACARRSALCASACACGAPPRCCPGPPAACTA